jgi:hypothetical protein
VPAASTWRGVCTSWRGSTHAAAAGVDINVEYPQTSKDVACVVLDVDPTNGKAIMDGLREMPETIKIRALW